MTKVVVVEEEEANSSSAETQVSANQRYVSGI
jgi:hypothetical protein